MDERKEQRRRRRSIRERLDELLAGALGDCRVHRGATAGDVLGDRAAFALLGPEPVRVARAVDGTRGIVLLDALDLDARPASIAQRAREVSRAFRRFERGRGILATDGKELRKIVVLLGRAEPGSPKAAVLERARRELGEVAEAVVDEDAAPRLLRQEAERIGALPPSRGSARQE